MITYNNTPKHIVTHLNARLQSHLFRVLPRIKLEK
jgi:hypothetical protein